MATGTLGEVLMRVLQLAATTEIEDLELEMVREADLRETDWGAEVIEECRRRRIRLRFADYSRCSSL